MKMAVLGGNNHRVEIQELIRLAAELNKSNSESIDDEKCILFEAEKYKCKEVERIAIEPTNKPIVKRGKGKVKRW